jgi:DNA repair photolyase
MNGIYRKTLLYKTAVEYGDYTINHVEGCSHGCLYPCYAFLMAKRFGKVKTYEEWIMPKIVLNAQDLLEKELPRNKDKIQFVHLCFSTDPFMYCQAEVSELSMRLIAMLYEAGIKTTALTKGILPLGLSSLGSNNEVGITLISLNELFRAKYEPFSAPYVDRIKALYRLHKRGIKTWVSVEPYPTPNIIKQDFEKILEAVSFVDKIIFGRLNYNSRVRQFSERGEFYNSLSLKIIDFCEKNCKQWHIKEGTLVSESLDAATITK